MSDERTDADTLNASLRALEQALDVARRAAQEAQQAGTRQHATLLVREQEVAIARAEAAGASGAVTKLQLELGATRASVETLEQQLAAERVRLAAVEQERAQAADRAIAVRADADAQLAAVSAAHHRDREQLEQRVATLRAEFDTTVIALHDQLEQERARHRQRIADLTRRVGELGGGVEAVRRHLETERDERTRIDEAAEDVVTATPAAEPAAAAAPAPATEPTAPADPAAAREPRWPRAAPPLQPGGPRSADLDGLLRRFDEIREQLAGQGIGIPPAPPADGRQA